MPNPDFEKVNVNDVIQSASDLHKENGNVSVHLRNYAEESVVSADKNQLLSVFNNLILNAIQSIPEDQLGSINIVSENYDEQVLSPYLIMG
jgi:nitrogen fixation/metabolism regulation signal transduction histidine kinase